MAYNNTAMPIMRFREGSVYDDLGVLFRLLAKAQQDDTQPWAVNVYLADGSVIKNVVITEVGYEHFTGDREKFHGDYVDYAPVEHDTGYVMERDASHRIPIDHVILIEF